MRARWITAAVVTGVLALPAGAQAGGWATVTLSSTPDGLDAGQPWLVELEILQHGRTPLDGVEPAVILTERETGERRTVPARPTGRPGIYLARAVFPSAGRWQYVVDDGFSRRHTYPAVDVGAETPAVPASAAAPGGDAGGGDFPWTALAAALAAGLGVAGLTRALQRRGGLGAAR
jgi:hypothetical protein